jgi:hypothetical protein
MARFLFLHLLKIERTEMSMVGIIAVGAKEWVKLAQGDRVRIAARLPAHCAQERNDREEN